MPACTPVPDWCLLQDLHEPQVVAALTSLCTASLQLQPVEGLLHQVVALSRGKQGGPHGQLQLRLKRHTGRVRVEAELYCLRQDGSLDICAMPQEAMTAQLLAAHAVQHAGQLLLLLLLICAVYSSPFSIHNTGCGNCKVGNACSTAAQQASSCTSPCLHLQYVALRKWSFLASTL